MPAIQKIRKHGALLILVIGAALFAFIAEEFFRSMETTSAVSRNQVGEVFGESLSYQEYQQMVSDVTEINKMFSNQSTNEMMDDQMRDYIWRDFVENKLIEHEAAKLGIYVTDAEWEQALISGRAGSLRILSMFADQSGKFDFTALQNFLKQYKEYKGKVQGQQMEQIESIHRIWEFAEKQLRRELLRDKFESIYASCFLSNKVVAKQMFDDNATSTTALVAALPYVALKDKVEVTDSDLKSAYDKYKELFRLDEELRDIKYIDVAVVASKADRDSLDRDMQRSYEALAAGQDPATVVSSSRSSERFVDLAIPAALYPRDIQGVLDSMAVGQTRAPYFVKEDNTVNVVKLLSKVSTPDSILSRNIFVQGASEEEVTTRHDSILNALRAGASFKDVAAKYGQKGDSAWVDVSKITKEDAANTETAAYLTALSEAGVGEYRTLEINGNKVIILVEAKRHPSTKYMAAVIKCANSFSKETYNEAKNKMNRFLADNKDLASVENAAAKAGYQVTEQRNFSSTAHRIGAQGYNPGVMGTHDAVTWVFDNAKEGQISGMYECGEAQDHLLVVGLTKVQKKGYKAIDDPDVKDYLTAIVTSEKKAEIAAKKFANVKSIADAQKLEAVVDTLSGVTFGMTPPMPGTQVPESAVAAVLPTLKAGAVSKPIIGTAGAYVVQVISQDKSDAKFEADQQIESIAQGISSTAKNSYLMDLQRKANVVDRRYKFFGTAR